MGCNAHCQMIKLKVGRGTVTVNVKLSLTNLIFETQLFLQSCSVQLFLCRPSIRRKISLNFHSDQKMLSFTLGNLFCFSYIAYINNQKNGQLIKRIFMDERGPADTLLQLCSNLCKVIQQSSNNAKSALTKQFRARVQKKVKTSYEKFPKKIFGKSKANQSY